MERHVFFQTWRRASPAPPRVRTCTPTSAFTPVLRRLTPRRRGVKPCSSAICSVAIDNGFEPSARAGAEPVVFDEFASQGLCSPNAVCPAVLQTRLSKAHTSAASAALVVQDMDDEKLVATASLDKGMAIWRFYSSQGECENGDESCEESIEVTRLKVPGAPVFSLAKIPEVLPDGTIVRKRPKPPGIYLGTSSKEVLTWMLGSKDVTDKVVLDGHTGWVRSLAVTGKWLFSCGCNHLRLWDTTFRTPKECDSVRLFTGDILAIASSEGRVFTAGADGSLRSWTITRAGELQEGPCRERSHEGRVSACVIADGRVFTVSYDGSVKAWNAETLDLLAEVKCAHNGDKIFCLAVASNGVLFTGGDDKLIRAWDYNLNPVGLPLEGHAASVRVLSAGRRALLVSGDADGDVCIWETYPVELPSATTWNVSPAVSNLLAAGDFAPRDSVSSLQGDILEALGSGEAVALDAARLQLENMMAAEAQPGVALERELAAVPAWAGPIQPEPQALSAGDDCQDFYTSEQQLQPEMVAMPAVAEELPSAQSLGQDLRVGGQQSNVESFGGDPGRAAAAVVVSSGANPELTDERLGAPCEGHNHHMNGAVQPSFLDMQGEVQRVMAATVSEVSAADLDAAVEEDETGPESKVSKPHIRQIEVESVASAVAAACLNRDVEGWTSACSAVVSPSSHTK